MVHLLIFFLRYSKKKSFWSSSKFLSRFFRGAFDQSDRTASTGVYFFSEILLDSPSTVSLWVTNGTGMKCWKTLERILKSHWERITRESSRITKKGEFKPVSHTSAINVTFSPPSGYLSAVLRVIMVIIITITITTIKMNNNYYFKKNRKHLHE